MHVRVTERGKCRYGEGIARRFDCLGEDEQRVANHVDDAMCVVGVRIGRQRHVGQQQAGEVARAAWGVDIARLGRDGAARAQFGVTADPVVEIEFLTLGLPRSWAARTANAFEFGAQAPCQ